MAKGLTDKQKIFVYEYLIDFNATQAAIRAGYSKDTAYSIGNNLLKKVEIQNFLEKYQNDRSEKCGIKFDYLNIPLDLWQYDEDFQDIYTDDTQKLNEIITVMQNGGAEVDDLVKFYFPTLSDEERAEKIARINESKQASTESSILSALNM